MKRKIILLLFIFLVSLNNSNAVELSTTSEVNKFENVNEKEESGKEEIKNRFISEKSSLKKELSNRRKYHKNLLNMYNKDFGNNNFELITQNGLIINNLENHYKLNFLKNENFNLIKLN